MITTTGRWRPARLRVFSVVLAVLAVLLVAFAGPPQKAHASVAAGDVVFERGADIYKYDSSSQSISALITSPEGYPAAAPDVSPDGSKIVYIYGGTDLYTVNSDGSGAAQVTQRIETEDNIGGQGGQPFGYTVYNPRWSPDGQWIVYVKYSTADGMWKLKKVHPDGSSNTTVLSYSYSVTSMWYPTWSPGSDRIAYTRPETYGDQVWIVDSSGSNNHRITSSVGMYGDDEPSWSPDGSRIYITTNEGYAAGDGGGIKYFTYTGTGAPFSTTSVTRASTLLTTQSNYKTDAGPRVSADGSTIYFDTGGHGASSVEIARVSSSGGAVSILTTTPWNISSRSPSPVGAAWPPAPPSNSGLTMSAPSSSDAPYTRQVTVNLPTTGIIRFELGWSTSSTTAPNTSYMQSITNMTSKKGPVNFLGKWASGTTWNGGTQPDSNWYLWARSVKTGNIANAWASPKLLVHTPKAPIWVSPGDLYASGHHQDVDEPFCPQPSDLGGWPNTAPPCSDPNAPYVTPNDYNFAWPTYAVNNYNTATKAPTAWRITVLNVALSGAATSTFGQSGTTVGSALWASGNTQAAKMVNALYSRYNSWNVVSLMGGADDTGWVAAMQSWYTSLSHVGGSYGPWAVPTANGTSDCPDSQSIYTTLTTGTPTLNSLIKTYLQGIVTAATAYSPGVRIVSVGYPDIVDSGNICFGDTPSWHGSHSVISQLNTDHSTLTGSNVKYVDLTLTGNFGSAPIAGGLIQTSRLYGYPHPGTNGQTKIAQASATLAAATTGW